MENCFRFLINVDQCLNMSYFDIFFYRLKSQHKFHMSSVQTPASSGQDSLRNAVNDIRMYLNKYPYHVGDYQIVVAMRSVFVGASATWQETILHRLLQLDYELRRAHILINSREKTDKALNLIMLYDSDFLVNLPELGRYKESGRLQKDCVKLLEALQLSDSAWSADTLEQAVQAQLDAPDCDTAVIEMLQEFLQSQRRNQEQLAQMAAHADCPAETGTQMTLLSAELTKFLTDRLCNMQLFEQQIDRNNRRQQTLALLRVVEFINMPTALPAHETGGAMFVPLAHRCATNWAQVWQDPALEQRYADMLLDYRCRLNYVASKLEESPFSAPTVSPLPVEEIPGADAITTSEGIFSNNDPLQQKNNLQLILKQFINRRFSLKNIREEWDSAYRACKQLLEQLEHALKNHADSLSSQYVSALETRKREALMWQKNVYVSDDRTKNRISQLDYEREQRLQELRTPKMNPTLTVQDQMNIESSLEHGNLLIQHYIGCLHAIRAGNFLMLIGICALLCFGHYTFLQPYVFQQMDTLLYYLLYLAVILVFMLCCWVLPYSYFKKKLRACIEKFRKDADCFIGGYYAKAEQFGCYINLLNQLDYITRYQRLLIQANRTSNKLSQGYLWHKLQVQNHLTKLQFFHGLIELGNPAQVGDDSFIPDTDSTQVRDYIDNYIYWPQGRGE